jgi:ClpP class serine protease
MGDKALEEGLIDNIGSYCDVLSKKYPECRLKIIKLKDEPI